MNLKPVNPPRDNLVLCIRCNKWIPTAHALADLDGYPFRSYFCKTCSTDLTPELAAEYAHQARLTPSP